MLERIKEIEKDINESANIGYDTSELKDADRREMDGYIFAIENMKTAFCNIAFDYDDGTILGKCLSEIVSNVGDSVYQSMIGYAVYLLYGMLDEEGE